MFLKNFLMTLIDVYDFDIFLLHLISRDVFFFLSNLFCYDFIKSILVPKSCPNRNKDVKKVCPA